MKWCVKIEPSREMMEREILNQMTLTSPVYGWVISYKGSQTQTGPLRAFPISERKEQVS